MDIQIIDDCDNARSRQVSDALAQWNTDQGFPTPKKAFTITLQDGEKFLGGATLFYEWNWLYVEEVIVFDRGKGLGTKLMHEVEALAKRENCKGIWLFTADFQAPEFYKKLGYKQVGYFPNVIDKYGEVFFIKEFLV